MVADYVIGLDLGGTKLASAIFTCDGENLEFKDALEPLPYDKILGGGEHARLTAEGRSRKIAACMAETVQQLSAGRTGTGAVGIASAGFIEDGIIVDAHNTGMKNFPLQNHVAVITGLRTFLYKDSWAPVFALGPGAPGIVFSIGTGFGGVSAESDMTIRLRSYSASRKIIWIPYLYFNDDPAFAASFSIDEIIELIEKCRERFSKLREAEPPLPENSVENLADHIRMAAREAEKLSPSRLTLILAHGVAFKAASRMSPREVYADFLCASPLPGIVYDFLTSKRPDPKELDTIAADGDLSALFAFHLQAEFIGYVLFKMQEERRTYGLALAERIAGTGSGFNPTTHAILSSPILSAMREHAYAAGINIPETGPITLLEYKQGPTTLACFGAAVGAANAISI